MRLLTTAEAAYWIGINSRSFARWARDRGISPTTVRGQGLKTYWSYDAIVASLNTPKRQP